MLSFGPEACWCLGNIESTADLLLQDKESDGMSVSLCASVAPYPSKIKRRKSQGPLYRL